MALRLILIRHAKSSWDDPLADDHARVLNDRGRKGAVSIGGWLRRRGYLPALTLVSNAARTVETWQRLDLQGPHATTGALYHASPDAMLDLIRKQTVTPLAVIGHNPGIGILARGLVARAPDDPRFDDYPTAATAVIDFDAGHWSDVSPETGHLVDFVIPDDLTA